MKINYLFCMVLWLIAGFTNAQTITFISENTNKPLPKVSVFGKDGSILAYSDIDGKIDKQTLDPSQEKFQLVYDNYSIATLSYSDFNKEIIKIDDKVREIETVVIKNNKPAKYIFIRGNFNSYVTVNNKLNCYADGVVTYIFDKQTKKLKSTNVEQYRVYRLEDPKNEKKQTSSWDYGNSLNLPKLKKLGNPEEYKTRSNEIKELKGEQKDEIQISGGLLLEKELSFLGYRFYDIRTVLNLSFEKGSEKTLKDFLEYNELTFVKLKHKSESHYNQINAYSNFYPTEISFSNTNDIEKVKFNKDSSNYQSSFWQDASFPNMQTVFSSFFKDDLRQLENRH